MPVMWSSRVMVSTASLFGTVNVALKSRVSPLVAAAESFHVPSTLLIFLSILVTLVLIWVKPRVWPLLILTLPPIVVDTRIGIPWASTTR